MSRAWYDHVVNWSRLRCFGRGRSGPRSGPPGHDGRDGRTGQPGLQQVAAGVVGSLVGRCAPEPLDQSRPDSDGYKEEFCAPQYPFLEHGGISLPEGVRGFAREEVGALGSKRICGGGFSGSKAQPKAKAREGKGCSKPGAVRRSERIRVIASSVGGSSSPSDCCYQKLAKVQSSGSVGVHVGVEQPPDVGSFTDTTSLGTDEVRSKRPGPALSCSAAPSSVRAKVFDVAGERQTFSGDNVSEFIPGAVNEPKAEEDFAKVSFSFASWCMSLTRKVLHSRTGFGQYLSSTLCLSRDGPSAPPTALFPLPLPNSWPIATGPDKSSSTDSAEAVGRALHVVVQALNYAYGSRSRPSLDLIRRQPNEIQAQAISRLRLLLESCDHGQAIQVAASGRKKLQLTTRLQELALAAGALGLTCSPYSEVPQGLRVDVDNSRFPQLQPFSNLVPERLKITGRGQWNAADYMEPELYIAFQEPQVIELDAPVFERGHPNFLVDSQDTVFELFKRWDDLGLLVLHPRSQITTGDSGRVKIFNAFKSAQHDRQIGDRRERNAWEARIPGPSSSLPVGSLITKLCIPKGHGVRLCVTDRSDYYHQIAVSHERSRTNLVWPPMPLGKFVHMKAYQKYVEKAKSSRKPIGRTVHGDCLDGHRPSGMPLSEDTEVYGSFGAILQGDHLGVEFGISAHVGLLQEHGLLKDKGRLVTDRLTRPSDVYEGLCIDDFFAIAPVPISQLGSQSDQPSRAKEVFLSAKKCYLRAGLQGSDAKDVIEADLGTVVGAEINSKKKIVQQGMLPVAAPAAKRLALSWIALTASQFSCTTDALHSSLVGGLVSAFCFKRCGMSLLNQLFKTIPPAELQPERPQLRTLSRAAAEELVLSAVLLPVLASDIKAPFHSWIYASDASTEKGAFCEAAISERLAEPLWQSGDFKGGFSRLDPWQRTVLQETGFCDAEEWNEIHGPEDGEPLTWKSKPSRPLAQYFDFIEICGGSGVISEEVSKYNLVVGPIIDLSYSSQYDLVDMRAVEWVIFLVQNHRVRAIGLEPPCTTFSAAAHPACRSYDVPRGWNQKSQKVWFGNRLAFACLAILFASVYAQVIALLETPRRSKMAWLEEWRFLLTLANVEETFAASCSFGSPFQKEFRFLTCNMRPSSICKPCTRDHSHTVIQGQLTKGSSVYCPGLAAALAKLFADHLRLERLFSEQHEVKAEGLESAFVNELLKKASWHVGASWKWTGHSHINVLELASALQAIKKAAIRGGGRVCLLLDSNVAVRAIAKGRSSSLAFLPLLRKIMAVSIAFGVIVSVLFAPTRLNVSDDPTRSVKLRQNVPGPSFLDFLDVEGLFKLAEMPPLRRWISNWTCLFLGLCIRHSSRLASLSMPNPRRRSILPPVDFYKFLMDFDSTLGFPGEGPSLGRMFLFALVFSVGVVCSHGMNPRNRDDKRRAELRAAKPLTTGRPVQDVTRSNRQRLLDLFRHWLASKGIDLSEVLQSAYKDPERVVSFLVEYGRLLYSAGRPYSHYSETINSVAAAKPTIRRMLTGAWDFAFTWLREEPGEHHVACPFQILLAILSLSILWGWPAVAGLVALSWGAVCRIGEFPYRLSEGT